MSSLRDRLLSRPRPSAVYRLQVADPAEVEKANRELALTLDAWRNSQIGGDTAEERRRRKAMDAAQTRLDGCYASVTVRAMDPGEFEALVEAHPARKDEDEAWNAATFPRACFLASVEGDLTRDEWGKVLDGSCSQGEREGLLLAALQVNVRAPDPSVGKG